MRNLRFFLNQKRKNRNSTSTFRVWGVLISK